MEADNTHIGFSLIIYVWFWKSNFSLFGKLWKYGAKNVVYNVQERGFKKRSYPNGWWSSTEKRVMDTKDPTNSSEEGTGVEIVSASLYTTIKNCGRLELDMALFEDEPSFHADVSERDYFLLLYNKYIRCCIV